MNRINFTKIQSTGNDFIVVNYASVPESLFDEKTIQKICHRHFGIGADGLIAVEKSEEYAFRFHYYNADGSRASMCGNGLRAAERFAFENKWVPYDQDFKFKADDGIHQGRIKDNIIKANILVNDTLTEIPLDNFNLPSWISHAFKINTGVPHMVLICEEDIHEKDIFSIGKELRYHSFFSPEGTNVNFVRIEKKQIYIRTYERGVENETLSCGTGVTASALVAKDGYGFLNDMQIITNGGNLKVTFENENIFINGPSECAFSGTIEI